MKFNRLELTFFLKFVTNILLEEVVHLSYRDENEALRARISSLEAELAAHKGITPTSRERLFQRWTIGSVVVGIPVTILLLIWAFNHDQGVAERRLHQALTWCSERCTETQGVAIDLGYSFRDERRERVAVTLRMRDGSHQVIDVRDPQRRLELYMVLDQEQLSAERADFRILYRPSG